MTLLWTFVWTNWRQLNSWLLWSQIFSKQGQSIVPMYTVPPPPMDTDDGISFEGLRLCQGINSYFFLLNTLVWMPFNAVVGTPFFNLIGNVNCFLPFSFSGGNFEDGRAGRRYIHNFSFVLRSSYWRHNWQVAWGEFPSDTEDQSKSCRLSGMASSFFRSF